MAGDGEQDFVASFGGLTTLPAMVSTISTRKADIWSGFATCMADEWLLKCGPEHNCTKGHFHCNEKSMYTTKTTEP